MARRAKPTPTDAEMEILHVLWSCGVCTVRDVHDEIVKTRSTSYASVSKMVSLMIDKGLVEVVDERRPQRIRAGLDKRSTLQNVLKNVRSVVFGGSLRELVRHLLGNGSTHDIDAAQQAIDEFKRQQKRDGKKE